MTVPDLKNYMNTFSPRANSPVPTILKNENGYVENIFEGKADQMIRVANYIKEKGFIPEPLIENEVAWFYSNLGIDDQYFALEGLDVIAKHIMALYGAKINAFIRDDDDDGSFLYSKDVSSVDISLERESEVNDRVSS